MEKLAFHARARLRICAALLAIAAPVAGAAALPPLSCQSTEGGSSARVQQLADDVRAGDRLLQQLVAWNGLPARCKGNVATGHDEGENWVEFSWPDGATFTRSFMPPEAHVTRYTRKDGIARADDVLAALRQHALRRGLRIDWNAPRASRDAGLRVVEYGDADPAVNAIVRVVYDRRRLVAVSMSVAL